MGPSYLGGTHPAQAAQNLRFRPVGHDALTVPARAAKSILRVHMIYLGNASVVVELTDR